MFALLFCVALSNNNLCCQDRSCSKCQEESQILIEVNALRARHGLWPLRRDVRLINGCRRHSWIQRRSGRLFHGYAMGECIAQGQNSPQQVVQDWYHSSGHRAILLSRSSSFLGASRSRQFWTLRVR